MFLVFSVLSLKMFLTCSYFPNAKILLRGAYLCENRIVLHCYKHISLERGKVNLNFDVSYVKIHQLKKIK